MAEKRMAYVDVLEARLLDCLGLPGGTTLLGITRDGRGNVRLLLGHDDLPPFRNGDEIPVAHPEFRHQPAVILTNWGLTEVKR